MKRAHCLHWLFLPLCIGLTGCAGALSLPLGGVAAGRGLPLGDGTLEVGSSLGLLTDAADVLPLLADSAGLEVNPRSEADPGGTLLFSPLGFSYGATPWLDVGLDFSRGLNALLEVVGNERWAVSLSPSLYRHSTDGGGADGIAPRRGAVTSLGVSGLAAYTLELPGERLVEVWGGGAIRRFSAWLETEGERVETREVAPSVLVGIQSRPFGRRPARSTPGGVRTASTGVSVEAGWTWLPRREDGSATAVPMLQMAVVLRGERVR